MLLRLKEGSATSLFTSGLKPPNPETIEFTPQVMQPLVPVALPKEEPAAEVCNCRKSGCLKLYCQCFAARSLCSANCNCVGCVNNDENCAVRQDAIRSILERNPNAFESKFKSVSEVNGRLTCLCCFFLNTGLWSTCSHLLSFHIILMLVHLMNFVAYGVCRLPSSWWVMIRQQCTKSVAGAARACVLRNIVSASRRWCLAVAHAPVCSVATPLKHTNRASCHFRTGYYRLSTVAMPHPLLLLLLPAAV